MIHKPGRWCILAGVIALAAQGCTPRRPDPRASVLPNSVCGMALREQDGVTLAAAAPRPVLRTTRFPASFMLDNTAGRETASCVFVLEGPGVVSGQLFFRFGAADPDLLQVEPLGPERLQIRYRVEARSYAVFSIEPRLADPGDPSRWEVGDLDFRAEGGALLQIESGIPRVRALGPATRITVRNAGKEPQALRLLLDNASERLSEEFVEVAEGSPVTGLRRKKPLVLEWSGRLFPKEAAALVLRPRPIARPFSFVFGGDVKDGLDTYVRLLAQVRAQADPLFMISIGDYTRNSLPGQLSAFFERTADLPFPVYYVKGNHEERAQGAVHFRRLFGPEHFSFTVADLRFVILDSTCHDAEGYRGYYLSAAELAFAEQALVAEPATRTRFLVLHTPPHPLHAPAPTVKHPQNMDPRNVAALMALASRHRVDYVLSGHVHLMARKLEGGTVYLTSAGGGAKLDGYETLPGFQIDTRKHLVVFDVQPDSILERAFTLP